MKLNKNFIVYNSDGKTILVPDGSAEFCGIIKGNKTFGAIIELLTDDITEDGIISAMLERFDAPKEMISEDVKNILSRLRSVGALTD